MPVSKNRDIATMLGKTETQNSANLALSVADGAGGGSLTVHDSIGALPLSTATEGNMAFVNSNSRMYVYNGNGWYSATIVNTTPTWADSIGGTNGEPAASYSIDDSATPLVVTVGATDPEGIPIRYLGTASDSADPLMQSIIVDSDVGTVTFTPNSSATVWSNVAAGLHNDSAGGVFTYTFKATDGINILSKDAQINYIGLTGGVVKPATQGTAWANATISMTDAYGDGGTFATSYNSSTYTWTMTTHSKLFDGMRVNPTTMQVPNGEFLAILWLYGFSTGSNDRGGGAMEIYNSSGTIIESLSMNSRLNTAGVGHGGSNPGTRTTAGASAFNSNQNWYMAYRYSPLAGSKWWIKTNISAPSPGANNWVHVASNPTASVPAWIGGNANSRQGSSPDVSIRLIDATDEFSTLTF
jgi:hypothetical protein